MKGKLVLFVLAFIVWCMLTWVPDWQHLAVGILIAALAAYVTGDLFISRAYILKEPKRYAYFIGQYLPVFIWECVKANFDVAYRVIHPMLPIKPGIVKVRTKLKSVTALTFLANSITLTPGTMSVDIDVDRGVLYIHWINVKTEDSEEATNLIVRRFEKILQKIFE